MLFCLSIDSFVYSSASIRKSCTSALLDLVLLLVNNRVYTDRRWSSC
jgi:hypothetical protein